MHEGDAQVPVTEHVTVWGKTVRIFRVPIGVVPGSFVGSDGTLKTREIDDDEDCTPCFLNVGSFWAVGLKDVPLLVRGGS